MKKRVEIEKMTDKEWAAAAAWLSGEQPDGEETAAELLEENPGLLKQWNEMKMTEVKGDIDVDKAWEKLSSRIDQQPATGRYRRMEFLPSALRAAAVIIVVLGLGWAALTIASPEKVTIASATDQKNIEVTLPDGSRVTLNHDSHLTYPETFGRRNRKVTLTGEAFFDITPDQSRPFTINAGDARVRVLGTTFNVITDNGNNEVEVFVSTGKVLLSSADGSRSLTLEPGFIGRLSRADAAKRVNTNPNYLSWNTDVLTYDGERLETVFRDIRHSYNIIVSTSDPEINDLRLTTIFDNQPHDTIIQVICTTFNLQAVKDGETYILSRR